MINSEIKEQLKEFSYEQLKTDLFGSEISIELKDLYLREIIWRETEGFFKYSGVLAPGDCYVMKGTIKKNQ